MKNNNIVQDKSFAFAIRVVNLYKYLIADKKEFVLSKQLLRSGTSIGANVEEAISSVSDKEYKEARESIYWLKLLNKTDYLNDIEFESLFKDAEEICKILGKILITTKNRNS